MDRSAVHLGACRRLHELLPHGLREFIPPSARRYERTRRMLQRGLRGADPFVALTRRRARLILTFTREALQGIPLAHRRKARAVVHIGVSPSEPPSTTVEPGTNPILTIASGSRLVHWKGFDLLVEAFARHLRGTDGLARLLITGDGPFRKHLEDLIARLDISDSVRLLGHLPSRADVYRVVGSADLYALPTLRDGPPVAILEAMAAGRPILCLDRAATAEMVPIEAAFKIPVISRAQVVDDIARSLGGPTLTEQSSPSWVERHAVRSEHHDWSRIGRTIDAVYRKCKAAVGRRAGSP